jgi:predicted metal-dependent phosphoesterase TrpH
MGSALSDTTYAIIYDLHSHTQASDGLLTPEALVHRAVEMRVGTLAITDHDTTDAIPAARRDCPQRAGAESGVRRRDFDRLGKP